MNGAFQTVLSLSLSGSLLILTLLILRPLLGRRLSRRWRYYVWLLVIARLLLPLSSPVSLVGTLFRPPEPPPAAVPGVLSPAVTAPAGNAGADADSRPAENTPAPPEPAAPAPGAIWQALRQTPGWIWLSGALLLLLYRMAQCRRFARLLRSGGQPVDDPALLDRLALLGQETGVRRPVELWENPAVSTPMLLGVRRPCIVLPSLSLSEEDFRYTVCHELVHCRRRDLLVKHLAQLALCVHWFNPLIWRMVREVDRACELSCDEAVMASLSAGERRAYGDTLLRAAGRGIPPAASLTLSESGKLLKERLDAIMNDRNTAKMSGAMSLLLALLLTAGAVAAGASTGAPGSADPETPAMNLSLGSVPDEIKGAAARRYTQEVYNQFPWFFELGWNVSEKAADYYPGRSLPLPSGAEVTVYYDPVCAGILEDPEALSALIYQLDRLRKEAENTDHPLTRALLVSVRHVGGDANTAGAYADLAEQAYREGETGAFAAAFGLLGEEEQRSFLNRCYEDGYVGFFAAAVSRLSPNSPLIGEFAQRSYADSRVSFFSVLANGYMDGETLKTWSRQAERDSRASFRAVLYDALDMDGEKEAMERELDRRLAEEYRAHGVTAEGKNYYYQGQLVHIFLDRQPNQSFYRLEMNPLGSIDIKILRDETGAIQGVAPLTEAERKELFGDEEPEAAAFPIDVASIEAGQTLWLGDYMLDKGDQIRYDVSAGTGNALQVGFARPGDEALQTVCCAVLNRRQGDDLLRCAADFTFAPPAEPGAYRLFLRAVDGALGNVRGSVSVTGAEEVSAAPTAYGETAFAAAVRDAAARDDAESLAAMVRYPLALRREGEPLRLEDPKDFLAAYDRVMGPETRADLLSADPGDLFRRWDGVMIGQGSVWFQGSAEDGFEIIAINEMK